ncbi:hypothetical protein QWJ26_12610 [Streptomyces sp. CSDS2]|uniref:hypothetical protein n=1 Tax=Streptomyces sp. CSDS2 TaxID=3055051 RepID=UPI0025B19970|nr:hypothetical protein [Streptomyces sp. CSDS2]MDN3260642.1 hypothetical protein [Streptomyces sp. CSDS2]
MRGGEPGDRLDGRLVGAPVFTSSSVSAAGTASAYTCPSPQITSGDACGAVTAQCPSSRCSTVTGAFGAPVSLPEVSVPSSTTATAAGGAVFIHQGHERLLAGGLGVVGEPVHPPQNEGSDCGHGDDEGPVDRQQAGGDEVRGGVRGDHRGDGCGHVPAGP